VDIQLTELEARVLGCLVEKQITTPEYYPITLNALTNACNQKSNRHPLVAFADTDVVRGLNGLQTKKLSVTTYLANSRVPKYRHVLPEKAELTKAETAIITELLLRGPQTVGELRTRASRMHEFHDLDSVQQRLDALAERGFVIQLPRQPGRKENRYAHLLCGEPVIPDEPERAPAPESATERVRVENERLNALEAEVNGLREDFAALKAEFAAFKAEFG